MGGVVDVPLNRSSLSTMIVSSIIVVNPIIRALIPAMLMPITDSIIVHDTVQMAVRVGLVVRVYQIFSVSFVDDDSNYWPETRYVVNVVDGVGSVVVYLTITAG